MDNDILINQARRLYAALHTLQALSGSENADRLKRLILGAHCRYQRRLNRCAICYRYRTYDCIREPGNKTIPCESRSKFNQHKPLCID